MFSSWNAAILTALVITVVGTGFNVTPTQAADSQPVIEASPVIAQPVTSIPSPQVAPEPAPITYTPDQQDAIDWATSRLEMVGLQVPETDIRFYPTAESCGHHDGLYQQIDGRHVLSICVRDGDSAHITMFRRRTVAHELVHAWEHENLDDHDREELMALLDTDVWYSADVEWKDRGGERLAETIVWGLFDQRHRPVLVDQPCHELHRDFIAITGHTALGPYENFCSPTDQP